MQVEKLEKTESMFRVMDFGGSVAHCVWLDGERAGKDFPLSRDCCPKSAVIGDVLLFHKELGDAYFIQTIRKVSDGSAEG